MIKKKFSSVEIQHIQHIYYLFCVLSFGDFSPGPSKMLSWDIKYLLMEWSN